MIPDLLRGAWRGSAAGAVALLALSLPLASPSGAVPPPGAPAPVDAAGLKRALAERKGKVVVLNFWATWCDPCREEFPDLVRLASEMAPKGTLVTVSLDEPESAPTQVKTFLDGMNAPGLRLIKGAGDPDAFISSVDASWSGALPATFVYRADGSRAHAIHGVTSYEALKKLVDPLLAAAVTPRTSAPPPAPSGKP